MPASLQQLNSTEDDDAVPELPSESRTSDGPRGCILLLIPNERPRQMEKASFNAWIIAFRLLVSAPGKQNSPGEAP